MTRQRLHVFTPGILNTLCVLCGMGASDPLHGYGTANPGNVSPLRGTLPQYRMAIPAEDMGLPSEREVVNALFPRAVARAGDPQTSWDAARSVRDIRASQSEVLRLFVARGAMTDEQVAERYSGFQSPSGLRTRRAELVALGRLRDTGHRIVGRSGRRMIVWDIDPQAT